jgi:hypothetical protein
MFFKRILKLWMLSAIIYSIALMPSAFAVREAGNGGDTYYSQMQESFAVAAEAMKKTQTLSDLPANLNQVFLTHKESWIKRLESRPQIVESTKPLLVDGLEKAAVADVNAQRIELNVPYWESRPVSMVQSIVLAIHEAGHLENIPLTHRELDQIGFALAQQNLKSYFGASGLREISERHKELAPRDKVIMLFEDTHSAATLSDFSYDKDALSCVVYPPKQEILYSHPAWFRKRDIELAPDSPLFPGGQKLTTLQVTFASKSLTYNLNPAQHQFEQTPLSLNYKLYADMSGDEDRYYAWAWLRFEFRKSSDLIVFKMNVNDSKLDSYGYCWNKK